MTTQQKADAKKYCPNPKDPTEGLRQKENGVWERAETIDGKRKFFSSRDPVEVWKKRAEYIAAGEERELVAELGPLFDEVADVYEEKVRGMKAGTQKSYLPAIVRARNEFGGLRMEEIEPHMIGTFLKRLGSMAQTTVSNQKAVVNAIFQTWVESPEWKGTRNTAELVKMPRGLKKGKRQPPTEDQVKIVKASVHDPDALPALLYLCTGERRGEGLAIRLQDIDFDKKLIDVSRSVEHIGNKPHITTTKTESGVRTIPLLHMLEEALEPLKTLPAGTYVIGGGKEPVTASAYRRLWERFWRKHNLATPIERIKKRTKNGKVEEVKYTDWKVEICAHQFRHEYVCMLCEADVPEEITILLVGHANAKMIHEVYLSLKPSMIQSTAEKLNRYLKQ